MRKDWTVKSCGLAENGEDLEASRVKLRPA